MSFLILRLFDLSIFFAARVDFKEVSNIIMCIPDTFMLLG
jgi:hypothetical protein